MNIYARLLCLLQIHWYHKEMQRIQDKNRATSKKSIKFLLKKSAPSNYNQIRVTQAIMHKMELHSLYYAPTNVTTIQIFAKSRPNTLLVKPSYFHLPTLPHSFIHILLILPFINKQFQRDGQHQSIRGMQYQRGGGSIRAPKNSNIKASKKGTIDYQGIGH
jgi:uncharacterized membrane protein (DUF106 family)